jgi:nucleoside-diphosphate-sugar epimerase
MRGDMKVFVTGHRGYIGTHLVGLLKEAGHHVIGCDLDLFQGVREPMPEPDPDLSCDVRSLKPRDLQGFDCIMQLAAVSMPATLFIRYIGLPDGLAEYLPKL